MKQNTRRSLGSTLILALGLLISPALRANQQQLASSIKEARAEALRTHAQLEKALSALNALKEQGKGNLRPAYDAFAAEIPRTQQAADSTRARMTWMDTDGQKYFDGWQSDINSISNKSLQKKAQKRLDAAKKNYAAVAVALREASEKFQPFLSDLKDIQKTLANDVTAEGVKAVRGTVNSANWNYKFVNRSINTAMKEMDKMEKSLSTEAK